MDQERFVNALMAAEEDCRELRAHLTELEKSERDPGEVVGSLVNHWQDHGDTYRTVGALVLDQARRSLLTQLYGWRRQLRQQLSAQANQRQTRPRVRPARRAPSGSGDRPGEAS